MHSICGQCHGGGSWCCSPGTLGMLLRQLWSAALGWFFTASKLAFLRIHCRFPYPCQCLLWGCVVHKQASKAEAKMDTSLLQIQVFFSALGYWSVKLSPPASDFFFSLEAKSSIVTCEIWATQCPNTCHYKEGHLKELCNMVDCILPLERECSH